MSELNRGALMIWWFGGFTLFAVMILGAIIGVNFFYRMFTEGIIFMPVEMVYIVFVSLALISGGFFLLLQWDKYWRERG